MAYTLTADVNPLFLNLPTDKGTTNVHYESPHPINLYRRIFRNDADLALNPQLAPVSNWVREALTFGANDSDHAELLEKKGFRTTPELSPGHVIEYGMLHRDGADPNDKGFSLGSFLALLRIDVLLKDSTLNLLATGSNDGPVTGGTFHIRRQTTAVPTYCVMQVGREEPTKLQGTNYYQMANARTVETSDPKARSFHDLMVTPLISSTTYFELTRISDLKGNWKFIDPNYTLKTKKREVTLELQRIHVHDTGDSFPDSDGEVTIHIRRYRRNNNNILQEHPWSGSVTDEGNYLINQVWTIAPEDFEGNDPGVGIALEGQEEDCAWIPLLGDTFCSTDNSGYQAPGGGRVKWLSFPWGAAEIVNPPQDETNLTIGATPNPNDGTLKFDLQIREVVNYV
jgi:hypothetical protein